MNVLTTIISLTINLLYQPYFFHYQPNITGISAYKNRHYLSQFIFYVMKLIWLFNSVYI